MPHLKMSAVCAHSLAALVLCAPESGFLYTVHAAPKKFDILVLRAPKMSLRTSKMSLRMSRDEPPDVEKEPLEQVVAQRGAQRSHVGAFVEVVVSAMSI